eukprot:TRINITY_DN9484_c0_g1_i1.p1 TRINITY_DN9484_c0_g1~~TRINITY_DN9484_c0_g1_i1.p1  ORF type:complete len:1319 (+),score=300.78 TRINITY_DN9484_c0_g1_i1:439-3957(+)
MAGMVHFPTAPADVHMTLFPGFSVLPIEPRQSATLVQSASQDEVMLVRLASVGCSRALAVYAIRNATTGRLGIVAAVADTDQFNEMEVLHRDVQICCDDDESDEELNQLDSGQLKDDSSSASTGQMNGVPKALDGMVLVMKLLPVAEDWAIVVWSSQTGLQFSVLDVNTAELLIQEQTVSSDGNITSADVIAEFSSPYQFSIVFVTSAGKIARRSYSCYNGTFLSTAVETSSIPDSTVMEIAYANQLLAVVRTEINPITLLPTRLVQLGVVSDLFSGVSAVFLPGTYCNTSDFSRILRADSCVSLLFGFQTDTNRYMLTYNIYWGDQWRAVYNELTVTSTDQQQHRNSTIMFSNDAPIATPQPIRVMRSPASSPVLAMYGQDDDSLNTPCYVLESPQDRTQPTVVRCLDGDGDEKMAMLGDALWTSAGQMLMLDVVFDDVDFVEQQSDVLADVMLFDNEESHVYDHQCDNAKRDVTSDDCEKSDVNLNNVNLDQSNVVRTCVDNAACIDRSSAAHDLHDDDLETVNLRRDLSASNAPKRRTVFDDGGSAVRRFKARTVSIKLRLVDFHVSAFTFAFVHCNNTNLSLALTSPYRQPSTLNILLRSPLTSTPQIVTTFTSSRVTVSGKGLGNPAMISGAVLVSAQGMSREPMQIRTRIVGRLEEAVVVEMPQCLSCKGVVFGVLLQSEELAGNISLTGLCAYLNPPIVYRVTPDSGALSGGYQITITGSNFVQSDGALNISLGYVPADIVEIDDSHVVVTAGATVVSQRAAVQAVMTFTWAFSKFNGVLSTSGPDFEYLPDFPIAEVVGGLAGFLVLIAIVVIVVLRWRYVAYRTLSSDSANSFSVNAAADETSSLLHSSQEWTPEDSMNSRSFPFQFQWQELKLGDHLGRGSYGDVYKARLWDTTVAVKLLLSSDGPVRAQFKQEVKTLSMLRHPNVVLFVAASLERLAIVTEFASNDSLYDMLREHPERIDLRMTMHIARGTARGMTYLHSRRPAIVHRDFKSANVLLDHAMTPKIADFGLAQIRSGSFTSASIGSPAWMAPELLKCDHFTEKCDVYSWGVVLWEMLTKQVPYAGMGPIQVLGSKMTAQQQFSDGIPTDTPATLLQILQHTTSLDPADRPTFTELYEQLRLVQKELFDEVSDDEVGANSMAIAETVPGDSSLLPASVSIQSI